MLRNMFIGDPPGNHNRLLDFSTALTGNLFFVPSAAFLYDPESSAEELQGRPAQLDGPNGEDGSLRIGSLLPDARG